MTTEYDDTRVERRRDLEPPAHKKRRETRQTLNHYQTIDLEELEELFEDEEVETFEPIKRR